MDLFSEIFEKFCRFPQPRWGTITVHHAAGVWPSQFKQWMGIQTFLHVEPGATVKSHANIYHYNCNKRNGGLEYIFGKGGQRISHVYDIGSCPNTVTVDFWSQAMTCVGDYVRTPQIITVNKHGVLWRWEWWWKGKQRNNTTPTSRTSRRPTVNKILWRLIKIRLQNSDESLPTFTGSSQVQKCHIWCIDWCMYICPQYLHF